MPSEGYEFRKWREKRDLIKNPNNFPYAKLEQSEDKYAKVESVLKDEYHPDSDISITYLWSDPKTQQFINTAYQNEPVNTSWFKYGKIPLSEGMTQIGNLMDGTPVRILVNSGATKAMINLNLYKKSKMLKQYPVFKIPTRKIHAANDQIIFCRKALKFPITIAGHTFEIIALLMPFTKEHDFIIGVKTMTELEATLDVARLEFQFRKRSIPINSNKTFSILPRKTVVFEA